MENIKRYLPPHGMSGAQGHVADSQVPLLIGLEHKPTKLMQLL